jgi:hypothetical protein
MKKNNLIVGMGVFIAAMGAALFGISSAASAAPLFHAVNVTVKVSGGDATALNQCINDAKDGLIQTQANACTQSSQAGNILLLEDETVFVLSNGFPAAILFAQAHVNVEITGGTVAAINACVNDAQDGFIQTQVNACNQTAVAGNSLALKNINVTVF